MRARRFLDRALLALVCLLVPVGAWLLLGGSGPLEPLVDLLSAASLLLLGGTGRRLGRRRRPAAPARAHLGPAPRVIVLPEARDYSTARR